MRRGILVAVCAAVLTRTSGAVAIAAGGPAQPSAAASQASERPSPPTNIAALAAIAVPALQQQLMAEMPMRSALSFSSTKPAKRSRDQRTMSRPCTAPARDLAMRRRGERRRRFPSRRPVHICRTERSGAPPSPKTSSASAEARQDLALDRRPEAGVRASARQPPILRSGPRVGSYGGVPRALARRRDAAPGSMIGPPSLRICPGLRSAGQAPKRTM